MRTLRLYSALASLGIWGSAHASFEMLLLGSSTPVVGETGPRVHRVDPITGSNFGSFQVATYVGMAASVSRGTLFTIDANRNIRGYNYSTGLRTSIATATGIPNLATDLAISADQADLYIAAGSASIYRFNIATGATSIVVTQAGASYSTVGISDEKHLYGWDTTSGKTTVFGFNGSSYNAGVSFGYSSGTAPNAARQMAVTHRVQGSQYLITAHGNVFGFSSIVGLGQSSGSFTSNTPYMSEHRAVALAHDGWYNIGVDNANSALTRVYGYDGFTYSSYTFTVSGINGGVNKAAAVLAPEPLSASAMLLALGFVLVKRRRTDQATQPA